MNLYLRYLTLGTFYRAAKYFSFSVVLTIYLYRLSLMVIQYAATLIKRTTDWNTIKMGFKR